MVINEVDGSDLGIQRIVYHTSVRIDSTHMVVGFDGYNETASVTIPRGDYGAMSIANMIVAGFNTIDGNRVIV